ncbi:hypothetical protein LY76DRAFT_19242 [Colletotrichum caudatum]|nr:hypothetical protein LY76DRAFT_19242 [Colletotrichum caudatum]
MERLPGSPPPRPGCLTPEPGWANKRAGPSTLSATLGRSLDLVEGVIKRAPILRFETKLFQHLGGGAAAVPLCRGAALLHRCHPFCTCCAVAERPGTIVSKNARGGITARIQGCLGRTTCSTASSTYGEGSERAGRTGNGDGGLRKDDDDTLRRLTWTRQTSKCPPPLDRGRGGMTG